MGIFLFIGRFFELVYAEEGVMDASDNNGQSFNHIDRINSSPINVDATNVADINKAQVDLIDDDSPIDLTVHKRIAERLSSITPLIDRPKDRMPANGSVLPRRILDETDLLAWTPVPREVSEFWRGASNMGVYSNPKNRQV